MGMPLDLYVIRHGESEANVIISAGEQGDNSLYTQDNVTVPDRSWRLTATGRKQADCIGRWLVSQQPLFDRYLVSPYVRTRETAATMPCLRRNGRRHACCANAPGVRSIPSRKRFQNQLRAQLDVQEH